MRIINFHLPAQDVERAATFYREVFGGEFTPFPGSPVPYWTSEAPETGGGAGVAITKRDDIIKAPVPTFEVENIDQTLLDVAMKGGRQGSVQDIPGIGRFGYAIDSESNVIALLQREKP